MNTMSLTHTGETIQVRIPMKLKKQSGRKMVIVPEGMENARATRADYQGSLVIALARAHLWEELIESGKFGSIKELSEAIGIDSAYVARVMRLTLLSPSIIDAIVHGREPSGLSYRALAEPLPMLWEEQKVIFGFVEDG
jgi:hypothetical protein